MKKTQDIKPILNWAKGHGDSKIIDRIIVKNIHHFVSNNLKLTEDIILNAKTIDVNLELYQIIKKSAENFVGSSFSEDQNNV